MKGRDVVIVGGVRTPIGRANKGSLVNTRPDDLSALVLRELVDRAGIDPALVEDIKWGCGFPEAEQGGNIGRQAALLAGFPVTACGMTVNRYCSSSLECINACAQAIATGCGEVMIAGGVESMSMIPMGGLNPAKMINAKFFELMQGKPMAILMTQTAQYIAEAYGFGRPEMDVYAKESQDKCVAAMDAGHFKEQIVPVPYKLADGTEGVLEQDECPRRGVSLEKMAALPPVVAPITPGHTEPYITAGNSCPLNDGAAAVLLMSREKAEELGLTPFVRIAGSAVAGVEPYEMGIGPVPATRIVLERIGLGLDDIDLIELNEAFAVQCLYFLRELGVKPERLNVNGGALALGHPFGMTGARLMNMLMYEMRRREVRRGLATLCVGGGMGVSMVVEREEGWK